MSSVAHADLERLRRHALPMVDMEGVLVEGLEPANETVPDRAPQEVGDVAADASASGLHFTEAEAKDLPGPGAPEAAPPAEEATSATEERPTHTSRVETEAEMEGGTQENVASGAVADSESQEVANATVQDTGSREVAEVTASDSATAPLAAEETNTTVEMATPATAVGTEPQMGAGTKADVANGIVADNASQEVLNPTARSTMWDTMWQEADFTPSDGAAAQPAEEATNATVEVATPTTPGATEAEMEAEIEASTTVAKRSVADGVSREAVNPAARDTMWDVMWQEASDFAPSDGAAAQPAEEATNATLEIASPTTPVETEAEVEADMEAEMEAGTTASGLNFTEAEAKDLLGSGAPAAAPPAGKATNATVEMATPTAQAETEAEMEAKDVARKLEELEAQSQARAMAKKKKLEEITAKMEANDLEIESPGDAGSASGDHKKKWLR